MPTGPRHGMIPPSDTDLPGRPRIPPGYRVGSVPYLNALPLTAGLEQDILLEPPSQLGRGLREERLDAALVSSTEILFSDRLRALSGYGILSRGPVYSVFLAHRTPLEKLKRIHVDPASCTSVNLLRVLLERRGIRPEFQTLNSYAGASDLDAVLLIGNPAIQFRRAPYDHRIWDLGAAWREWTGLPFVYALWAVRDGVDEPPLARALHATAESGLARLPQLIERSTAFDFEFRRAYVGGHIQYELDAAARAGLEQFRQLLSASAGRPVHPVRWIPAPTNPGDVT